MKKYISLFVIILSIFTLSSLLVRVQASDVPSTKYTVTMNASFDSDNILGPTIFEDKAYGSIISFDLSGLTSYDFDFWLVNGKIRYDLPVNHQFVVTGNMAITAVFSQTDRLAVVFVDSNGDIIETKYTTAESPEAVTAPVVSSYSKPGYVVDSGQTWNAGLTGITESCIRILQYNIDIESEFTLTVFEGVVNTTPNGSDDKFMFNTVVEVEADTPRLGEKFSHWEVDGQKVSYDQTINITVIKDISLQAVYVLNTMTVEKTPLVSIYEADLRLNYDSFIGQMYLPEGHELIDFGFLESTDLIELSFNDAYRVRIEKHYGATGEYLASFNADIKSAKAYLVTKFDGTLHYTYSQQINDGLLGEGTEDNPYLVNNIAGLEAIRSDLSAYYTLTADLDLTAYNSEANSLGWLPIGDSINQFTGYFDGQDHYIKGLTINRPSTDNVGLFGHIGVSDTSSPTTIKNIVLIDVDITGNRGTGALVGRVTGNQHTLIENAGVINGSVRGTGATGGLVGSNNSFTTTGAADRNPVVRNSFSVGITVYGLDTDSRTYEKFGGLIGCSQKGSVYDSYAISTVNIKDDVKTAVRVGGLIGCNIYRGYLTNSYSASGVTASNSSPVGV
ncbi:MAG: hypothetical protein WC152_07045, partial [Candidatus Izemoplasmatales bacterium]